ncbi:MAG TPA: hypothetical protein VGD00_09870, partial [Solirubrobacteraceae bacterium]
MDERERRAGRRERRAGEQLPDEVVLAAVARAALHRVGHDDDGATLRDVRAHLGIAARTAVAVALRARLTELERRRLLASRSERGVAVWAPTPAARRLLSLARAEGREPRLAESPQHADWRRARTLARLEIGRLAADLRDSLGSCEQLLARLDGPPARAPHSDEWFALADRLRRDCRRLGSAQHCLREWHEPDDARADV